MVKIREAFKKDSNAIATMMIELYDYHSKLGVPVDEQLPAKSRLKILISDMIETDKTLKFYICETDTKEIAGYMAITDLGKDCIINYLYVKEKHRGRGYGTELLTFAKEKAIENKKEGIRISNMVGNESAADMYDKLGFKAVKITRRLSLC